MYDRKTLEKILWQLVQACAELSIPMDDRILGGGTHAGPFRRKRLAPALDDARLGKAIPRIVSLIAQSYYREVNQPPIRFIEMRMLLLFIVSNRTLREAIKRCDEYLDLLQGRLGRISLINRGQTAEIQMSQLAGGNRKAYAILGLFGLARFESIFSWLIGCPLAVELAKLETCPGELTRLVMPYPIQEGAARASLLFPARFLDFPIVRTANDLENSQNDDFRFIPWDEPAKSLDELVRANIRTTLREFGQLPPVEAIAGALGVNSNTLRRQLRHAGTSYSMIKDSCRLEYALELLSRTDLMIEEIAGRLGFCDSNAFRRSFQGWMGVAPSTYRSRAS